MYEKTLKIKQYALDHNIDIETWCIEPSNITGINHHIFSSVSQLRNPYGDITCLGKILIDKTYYRHIYIITYQDLQNEIMDRISNPQ